VEKNNSTIFRYIMTCIPLFDHGDSTLNIGDQWYESQGGHPIRPYHPGL